MKLNDDSNYLSKMKTCRINLTLRHLLKKGGTRDSVCVTDKLLQIFLVKKDSAKKRFRRKKPDNVWMKVFIINKRISHLAHTLYFFLLS